ncbi:MAG: YaiO family outer membrane beta-barrel protein [Maribacter sp.]|nr:YaiO family outer membrane beta-barrel protein [Maribacter sp.]
MALKHTYCLLIFGLLFFWGSAQDLAYGDTQETPYVKAYKQASHGNHSSATELLIQILVKNPDNLKARSLLASTYSWNGEYDKARSEFNTITSIERNNRDMWISAIKNELYAKQDATALGLANKALVYLKSDSEVDRLKKIATDRIKNKEYPELAWYNQESSLTTAKASKAKNANKAIPKKKDDKIDNEEEEMEDPIVRKTPVYKEIQNNRVAINNSFTIFDQRYDPMVYSSISFKRQTLAGSIIPRINYSNRLGKHGLQYDLDFYPKFSKRLYAYLNYGYSTSSIYPSHKVGGDLYANLPGAIEFSAGGRLIKTLTQTISVVTNSLGYYKGNYYFSLRSYITPRPDNLTRFSGNLLVRKYLKDADNYMGVNIGMGISPELRQLTSEGNLLAETYLYIESQRLRFEYQFTGKNPLNIYRANLGVARQELAFDSGNFFYGVSAGLTYQVKF